MGMDNYIEKISNVNIRTNEEFDFFWDMHTFDTEELFCYRRHYWLDNFFRTKCKNKRAYDSIVLVKEDIELLIKEIEIALITDCSNFRKDEFYHEDINNELNSALKDMKVLLYEDFENNAICYDSCS